MELESTLVEAIVGMGSKLQHLVASQVQLWFQVIIVYVQMTYKMKTMSTQQICRFVTINKSTIDAVDVVGWLRGSTAYFAHQICNKREEIV